MFGMNKHSKDSEMLQKGQVLLGSIIFLLPLFSQMDDP